LCYRLCVVQKGIIARTLLEIFPSESALSHVLAHGNRPTTLRDSRALPLVLEVYAYQQFPRFLEILNAYTLPAVAPQCFFLQISLRNPEKMSTSDSYIIQDASPESSNDQDEIDSLPSSIVSSDLDSEEESDAQKEWEASLQQLELILTMMIVPYAGKYFGRKFAYWSEWYLFTGRQKV
jgi:hypothetical protein